MLADEERQVVSAEHTHSAEGTHSATADGKTDYLEKARELADSYSFLVQRKAELEHEIEESRAWFYTRDDAIYKLSMGAHEESERVQTGSISNTVERTVLNCDKVLASMNREIQNQRMELLIQPYRDVCAKIELFEIALRSMRGMTRLVAEQLYVQHRKLTEVCDVTGKPMGRRSVEAEREKALSLVARILNTQDRRGYRNGKTTKTNASSNERPESDGENHMSGLRECKDTADTG